MECLVCRQKIKHGEPIFVGIECRCDTDNGEGCFNLGRSKDSSERAGAIHLSCLESPAAVAIPPIATPPEPVEKELIVQRSDALALFDM